jgi:hypothetical protein
MVCGYVVSEGLILSLKMVDVWNEREREREAITFIPFFLFFFFSTLFSIFLSLYIWVLTPFLFYFPLCSWYGSSSIYTPLYFLFILIFYNILLFFYYFFLSLSSYLLVIWRVGQNFAFLFFSFFFKICLKIGVKNELRQLPSLYNTYGINTLKINICLTLYSKFVKKRKITQEKKVFFFGRTSKWKTKVIMSNDIKA